MKQVSWLVVANNSLAKIYKLEKKDHLTELLVIEHPESRLHNRDLVSDKPGRDFESGGTRRHALEAKTSPKQQEFAHFAKQIADHLENARNQNEFHALYIAASPALLGLLRQELYPNTAKLIKGEIAKDLTQIRADEISAHFSFNF